MPHCMSIAIGPRTSGGRSSRSCSTTSCVRGCWLRRPKFSRDSAGRVPHARRSRFWNPVAVPDVSIIIVSFNARSHLDRCLQSLHFAPPARTHETIVVDNASTDGSAEAARRWSGVRVIDAGSNLGFAAANNIGIRASSGRNLLLLNSDTIVPAGAVDTLLAVLEAEPSVGVVGPRLVDRK